MQVGTGNQAAGDAHFRQLLMGQRLFVDEAGSGGGDLGLVEATNGGQPVALQLGDHPSISSNLLRNVAGLKPAQ